MVVCVSVRIYGCVVGFNAHELLTKSVAAPRFGPSQSAVCCSYIETV